MSSTSRQSLALPLLWGAVSLAYLRSLGNGFCFDDWGIVVDNPLVTGARWREIALSDYWSAIGASTGLYRPLTTASFALNHLALGSEAWGFHLVNLVLHLVATSLLFLLLRRWLGPLGGLAGGLCFGLHPALSEAVVGVVGRAELLSGCLGLAAVSCLYPDRDQRRPSLWAGLALLAGAAFAKESGICFGLAVAVWAFWHQRGRTWVWAGALGAVGLSLLVKLLVLGQLQPGDVGFIDNPLAYTDTLSRVLNSAGLLVRYLSLLVFPWPLSADYSYDQIPVLALSPTPALWAPVALILTLVWLGWRLRAGDPGLGFWVLLSGGALLLVANLFVPGGTIFAERLLYLPALAFAAGAGLLARGLGPRRRVLLIGGWSLVAMSLAWTRCGDWKDDLTLFRATVERSPASARSHYGLGEALQQQGDLPGALAEYRLATGIYPRYAQAWYNQGAALLATGRQTEALASYRQAVAIRPDFTKALYAVAVLVRELEGDAAALGAFESLLAHAPAHAGGVESLIAILLRQGRGPEAAAALARGLALAPDDPELLRIQRLLRARGPGGGTATDQADPRSP